MISDSLLIDTALRLTQARLNSHRGPVATEYGEDIKGDVMLRVFEEARKDRWTGKPDGELMAYLHSQIGNWTLQALNTYGANALFEVSIETVVSHDEAGDEVTLGDTLEGEQDIHAELEVKMALEELRQELGWRDYTVLYYYHGYGYSPREIIEMHPELGIQNIKTIYKIINDNKRGE